MKKSRQNVVILALCQALLMSGNSLVIAVSALVGSELAPSPIWVTLPLGLQYLSAMATTIPASLVMKRIGRKRGFLLGLAIGIVGALISGWAIMEGDFFTYCLGAALIGIFNSFGQYYRFAAADIAEPDFRSKAISLVMAGGVVAAFTGPNLANWSSDFVSGALFAGGYFTLALLQMIAAVVLVGLRLPRPLAHEIHAKGRSLVVIALQPRFVVAVVSGMVSYGVMSLVMVATPLAMSGHGFHFSDTALVIQWHLFGMFAPSFITGYLINRFGVLNIMLIGTLLLGISAMVNLTGVTREHFWVALFLLGIGWNFLFVGATDLVTTTYKPEEKARAQGLNDFFVFSLVGITALSSGLIQNLFGWVAVNLSVLPVILVVLVSLVWLKRLENRTVL